MSGGAAQGLAEAYAVLGAVPEAAKEELGVELAIIARDALSIQQAAAPSDTGALRAGLSLQLLIQRLTVRIGLIGLKGGRASLFYGRIVNFGRRAQTVLVQRRRRVNGQLRSSRRRKVAADIAATYPLKVRPRAAVDFIGAPGVAFERDALGRLAEYWSRVLARAETAA